MKGFHDARCIDKGAALDAKWFALQGMQCAAYFATQHNRMLRSHTLQYMHSPIAVDFAQCTTSTWDVVRLYAMLPQDTSSAPEICNKQHQHCACAECVQLTCPVSSGFYVINVQLW